VYFNIPGDPKSFRLIRNGSRPPAQWTEIRSATVA
jgi:hypothetical protein